MDRKAILERIGEIIADINEQYEHLAQSDRSDRLETELFAANAKFLADHIQILQKFNHEDAAISTPIAVGEPEENFVQDVDNYEPPIEPAISSPVSLESAADVTEPASPQIVPSRNDLMANRPELNLAAKFSQEPIQDLKRSISLNDKLVFVKDLFNGYSLAYQEAIDQLERLEDFESADQYLKTHYVEAYNWAEKSATAEKFYDLMRRKFAK